MADRHATRRALFGLLFFLSGAAGLVYEQIWIRELYQFFGSTIHSITTVVAAYMGGLGLGAYVIGRRADRHPNPARLYGLLELAIGVFGILSPLVFVGVGRTYLGLAGALEPGLWTATAIKFGFAFVVMLVPAFLMGATLPVLTQAFTAGHAESYRRELALFYGLNTIGGVAGCALAGYVLVEHVGLRESLLATGVLNLLLGGAAMLATRADVAAAPEAADDTGTAEHAAAPPAEAADPDTRRLALWLIGLTAFASLLYEIAWTRVLVLVVGSSTYAFTTILACFLLGIGLGSLVASGRGLPTRALLVRAGIIQGAIAVLAALLFPFFRALPVYIVGTLQIPFLSVTQVLTLHGLALAVVVIPPAVGMGLIFPVLAEVASSRRGTAGGDTGRAYFANTAGSILGSVITGFVLIHTIGSERTLVLGILCNVAGAAALAWWLYRLRGEPGIMHAPERMPLVLSALALVIALGTPKWSNRLLDRGPAIYGRERMDARGLQNFLRGTGAEQLRFDEGWNAAISVWRNGGTTWLKSNGKADASSVADMNTQVAVGLLPAVAHPAPKQAFVIGFGSGVSVRTLADVPGMERLDVVEIERAVLHAAPLFADVNGGVQNDPRVHIAEDDARSALQLSRRRYDIILSEPSNPWIAGIASLYTREFFRVASSRLADGGILSQWLQTYRVPTGALAVVVANMRAVFPYVEIWFANPSDLVILASRQPIRWNHDRLATLLEAGTATGRAFRDWLEVDRPSRLLGRFLLGERGTAALAGTAAFLHGDNRPALEFVAARGLIAAAGNNVAFDSLLALRQSTGDTLPLLGDWTLAPGEWQAAYGYTLPEDRAATREYADAAIVAAPANSGHLKMRARLLFNQREFRAARTALTAALERLPDDPDLLLMAGITASALGDLAGGRTLLERAREAGGDSIYATSVLAETAVGEGDWQRGAVEALRALRGLRPTIASPFPQALSNVVRSFALQGPPQLAAPVLELARETRPSWDLAWWGGAQLYARWGGDHCRQAAALVEELPRFGWTDREAIGLLRPCAKR